MVTGPVVVLTGPPAVGKTTVGSLVADELGVELADTDALIEAREGRSIPDIFVEEGEPRFRAVEKAVVADALCSHPGVLALGGGAILDAETRDLLADHRVVFLDVSLAAAVRRSGLDHGRPLLAVNPRATWRKLMDERRPLYEEVASVRIDTSELTPQAVAAIIVAALPDDGPAT